MAYTLYIHRNKINGKEYAGITSISPEKRWKNGNHYKANRHFNNAIKKYGWDNFEHIILNEVKTEKEVLLLETSIIKKRDLMNPTKGYNKTAGGEHPYASEDTKKRLSEIRRGKGNSFYGKTHSKETKELISKNRKGKCIGIDHPKYGKPLSKITMEKLKDSGTWYNEKMQKRNEELKKDVLMIDKNTKEVLREFKCVSDAVEYLKNDNIITKYKVTKSSIYSCIYEKHKTSYGYIWEYKEEQ